MRCCEILLADIKFSYIDRHIYNRFSGKLRQREVSRSTCTPHVSLRTTLTNLLKRDMKPGKLRAGCFHVLFNIHAMSVYRSEGRAAVLWTGNTLVNVLYHVLTSV